MKRSSLLTVGVALLAGVIAFVAIRSFLEPKAPPAAEIAPMPGAPATASGAGDNPSIARKIPEKLPDFTLSTLEGPPKAISSFTQPSLVVNFWATWCAPCRREIPLLRQIRAERGAKGVEVVGVAVDFREDIVNGVIKSVVFGVAVTWIALFEGYDSPPTAEGVSGATTRTVVTSSLAILGLDFVLTAFMFRGI